MLVLYMLLSQLIYLYHTFGQDVSIKISNTGIDAIVNLAEEIFDIETNVLNLTIEQNSTVEGSLSIFHNDIYFQNFSYSDISIRLTESQMMYIKVTNVSLFIPSFGIESKYKFMPSIYSICTGSVSAEFTGWDFEISLSFKEANNFCRLPLVVNESSVVIFMYNDKLKIDYSLQPKTCSIFQPIIDIYLKKIAVSTLPIYLCDRFRKILLHKLLPYTQTIRYDDDDLAVLCYDTAYIQIEENINETLYELSIDLDLIVNKSDERWNYTQGHNHDANIVYRGPADMYDQGFMHGIEHRKKKLMNIVIVTVSCISFIVVLLFLLYKWNKRREKRNKYSLVEMGMSFKHERKYGSLHSVEEEQQKHDAGTDSHLHQTS